MYRVKYPASILPARLRLTCQPLTYSLMYSLTISAGRTAHYNMR